MSDADKTPTPEEQDQKKNAGKEGQSSSPLSAGSVSLPTGPSNKDREGRATMVGLPADILQDDVPDVRRDDEGIDELVVDHGGVAGGGDLDDLDAGNSTAALAALPEIAEAWLVNEASKESRAIEAEMIVGREAPSSWVVDQPTVSKKHFRIYRDKNRYFLQDLKATNGTYLNGRAVKGSAVQLRAGDQIIAAVTLKHPTGACSFEFTAQEPK